MKHALGISPSGQAVKSLQNLNTRVRDELRRDGILAYIKTVKRIIDKSEEGVRASLIRDITGLYRTADVIARNDDLCTDYIDAERWAGKKSRPKGWEDVLSFLLADIYDASRASGYWIALRKCWQDGEPAGQIAIRIREAGGLDKMRRANSKGKNLADQGLVRISLLVTPEQAKKIASCDNIGLNIQRSEGYKGTKGFRVSDVKPLDLLKGKRLK